MNSHVPLFIVGLLLFLTLSSCQAPWPLIDAVDNNDAPTVARLIDQGMPKPPKADIDFALTRAVFGGHTEVARVLLDRGANVNLRYYGDRTLLYSAVTDQQVELVKLLVERGAVVDERLVQKAKERGRSVILRILENALAGDTGSLHASSPPTSPRVAVVPPLSSPLVSAISSSVNRVPALSSLKKKHAYAVVIGIEQYREKLPKADYADRDAKLVGEYLTKVMGYPEENVIVQVNERATGRDLEKYFESWLPNNVEKDGSVFVYYSGHGSPSAKSGDAYLVPYDGDPAFLETTGYPLKRLYAALEKLPAGEVTVVLDSCFSGAGGRSVIAQGLRPMGLSVQKAMKASGKTIVLSASSGEQVSSTYMDQGHGLMTYFFLKGLQGEGDTNHDGVIELAELFEYVKPNVQRIARKQYNNEQTPQLLANPEATKRGGGRLVDRAKQ